MMDDVTNKIHMLLRIANTTTDRCFRERCCREAKALVDELGPVVNLTDDSAGDTLRTFITTFYEITMDTSDKVSKTDFDSRFIEWSKGMTDTVLDKKTLTRLVESFGPIVNRRGTIGKRKGIYTYEGIKEREGDEMR